MNGQSGDEQLINQRVVHVLSNAVWSAECRHALWKVCAKQCVLENEANVRF